MLTNISNSVFSDAESISMSPVVSAEWNHNLFNPPYLTVAGIGTQISKTLASGTISDVTVGAKKNFTTKSFELIDGVGNVSYSVIANLSKCYKIVCFVKTTTPSPTIITAYATGEKTQYGSATVEATSLGWTKVVTYVSNYSTVSTASSFTYTLNASFIGNQPVTADVYFTVPEIYETSNFDYLNHSLWPTESVFSFLRPGESYVSSGNNLCTTPSNYRKINTQVIKNYLGKSYFPMSAIIQNPQFSLAKQTVPVLKTSLPTDTSAFKYFVSDNNSPAISGIYEKAIPTNKIIIKLNTLMTRPTINIAINGTTISVDSATNIAMPLNSENYCTGLLTLYWTGSAWTQTKWSSMPKFSDSGSLSPYTNISKITVSQITKEINSDFSSYSSEYVIQDLSRMQCVEISPRLEVDLSDFIQSFSVDKSLDSGNNNIPISSINTNSAQFTLSGIPALNNNVLVPIFSSQSDQSSTVLANILRKGIKIYAGYKVSNYSILPSTNQSGLSTYIPAGIFYADSWDESDIDSVSIQAYDVSRYLQSTPAPDYVASLKPVFDIVSNILDLAGFSDYDYDSLYNVCNNKSAPMDISYYYVNSKDTTVLDALNKILLPYQVAAYVDEYGVMKFKGLYEILSSTASDISLTDSQISQGGYSISNKSKPGKISVRYQPPKIKQSPSLQNVTNPAIANSASFVYTTSNDVVWQQQSIDSVGFNYLNEDMAKDDNHFVMNVSDLLDQFHTINRDANGYAFIDNEIVSMSYKEYGISKIDDSDISYVSIKNDTELQAEINNYIKEYAIGLTTSTGTTKADYDVKISPTGAITNVQRGLFGTVPRDHSRAQSLVAKNLSAKLFNSSWAATDGSAKVSIINDNTSEPSLPSIDKFKISGTNTSRLAVIPNDPDYGYKTYSVKFDFPTNQTASAGLFFNMTSTSSVNDAVFVEVINYQYIVGLTAKSRAAIVIYRPNGDTLYWADITGQLNNINNNFSKIIKKTVVSGKTIYSYVADKPLNLKVAYHTSDGSDGENATVSQNRTILSVYLNSTEITGWQKPGTLYNAETSPTATGWQETSVNLNTGKRQKPSIALVDTQGKKFGFHASLSPATISNLYPQITYASSSSDHPASLREIHATEKALRERSVSYFYQDREFLNGLVQGRPIYSTYHTYLMQTTPEIAGINTYDVQYTTPAAVSVDVLPIEYMWTYLPGNLVEDKNQYQKKLIDEYSLSYSTPINSGFRCKMAIANNSQNMVFLHKESDDIDQFTINLNLWTHQLIAPSDPEVEELIIDTFNSSETVQLDSEWIQSKESAYRILKTIELGLEGFSKDVTLNIFGNPLIQVGDTATLTYSLNGIYQQKYIVHSVSNSFSGGLETTLKLNRIQE